MRGVLLAMVVWIAATSGAAALDRYAIEVAKDDPQRMAAALETAVSLAREYAARGEDVEIRVVAHGPGLALLRSDVSPLISRLKFTAQSMGNISFAACEFTRGQVAQAEGAPPPILSLAGRVANGPQAIEELRAAGWTIIRP